MKPKTSGVLPHELSDVVGQPASTDQSKQLDTPVLQPISAAATAGDLDEAVQALKATTNNAELASSQADNATNGASGLTDDDLKPAFMRCLAADKSSNGVTLPARNSLQTDSPAKERPPDDINPRPIARRRIDSASAAKQTAAKAVLQASTCPVFSEYHADQWLSAYYLYDQAVSSIGKPSNITCLHCVAWSCRTAGLRVCMLLFRPTGLCGLPLLKYRWYQGCSQRRYFTVQKEVPDLLEILQQKGLADQVGLLEHAKSSHAQDSEGLEQTCLYDSVHNILAKACKANSWQGRIAGASLSHRLCTHLSKHWCCSTANVQTMFNFQLTCVWKVSAGNGCPCVSCERIFPVLWCIGSSQAHIFMACPDAKTCFTGNMQQQISTVIISFCFCHFAFYLFFCNADCAKCMV